MNYYQICSLVIKDPQNKFCGEVFINEEEISTKGSLIIILEIELNRQADLDLINNFFEIAYRAYQQSIGITQEKILEDILHQLNNKLPYFKHRQRDWYKKINAIVALLFEDSLFFSAVGNISAFLVRQLQITDLLKEKIESGGPLKLFTTIINGTLNQDDAFLFTTPALLDFIALEKIKKLINTLPPLSAVENLKNLLTTASPFIEFLAVVIKQRFVSKKKVPAKIISYQTSSQSKITAAEHSLNLLLEKQKQTARIISTPTLIQTVITKVKSLLIKLKITKKQSSLIKIGFNFLIVQLIKIIKLLMQFIYQLIKICLGLIAARNQRQKTINLLNQKFIAIINYYKNLSKVKKISWLIILIAILVLSQNLIFTSRRQLKIEEEKNYQTSLNQIKNYQDNIEAALIYNDQQRAQEMLVNLINTLNNLPKNNKERIVKAEELQQMADLLIQRVWKMVKIAEPLELINLENNQTAKTLKILNNQLVIFSDNKYWTTPLKTLNLKESVTQLINLSGSYQQPKDNKIILWTSDNKIFSYQDNNLNERTTQYSPTFKNITDLGRYRDALYILDKSANQIYKHNPLGENFGPGLPWVKDPQVFLTKAFAMAIDGNVYVLEANGQIQKYLVGKKQDFPKINIYPYLANPTKIFTDSETINLYILDPANKRMLVFSKNGELIYQYFSEKFDNLIDFVILEKERKIYLLNGSKVYVISIF